MGGSRFLRVLLVGIGPGKTDASGVGALPTFPSCLEFLPLLFSLTVYIEYGDRTSELVQSSSTQRHCMVLSLLWLTRFCDAILSFAVDVLASLWRLVDDAPHSVQCFAHALLACCLQCLDSRAKYQSPRLWR
jgi:hypothetical protein